MCKIDCSDASWTEPVQRHLQIPGWEMRAPARKTEQHREVGKNKQWSMVSVWSWNWTPGLTWGSWTYTVPCVLGDGSLEWNLDIMHLFCIWEMFSQLSISNPNQWELKTFTVGGVQVTDLGSFWWTKGGSIAWGLRAWALGPERNGSKCWLCLRWVS